MAAELGRNIFGTSPQVCEIVWDMLLTRRPPNSVPEHLLWGLLLLKQYNIESVNAILVGVTEKTFRKWSLIYIRLIANLSVVNKTDFGKKSYTFGLTLCIYTYISLIGRSVLKTLLKGPPCSFLLTERTFVSWNHQSSTLSGFPTNFTALGYDTKLDCVSAPDTLFGPTEDSLVENGRIWD